MGDGGLYINKSETHKLLGKPMLSKRLFDLPFLMSDIFRGLRFYLLHSNGAPRHTVSLY